MKNKLLVIICFVLFNLASTQTKAQFNVVYPANTSLTSPKIVYGYTDTANGKIVMNGWPYSGNIIVNLFNISNGNFPCGISFPYPSNHTFYLKDMYTGSSYTACYASGPIPDTIKYDIRNGAGIILDTLYYLIDPNAIPTNTSFITKKRLQLYPNPTSDYLTLDLDEKMYTISVFNVNGKEVLRKEINKYNNTIDVKALPIGLYILKCQHENDGFEIGKFVKQ